MIDAYFLKSQKSITVEGITQGDYGQQLAIQGLNLPLKVEVHFALVGDNNGIRTYGTTADGITTADIPNTLIAKGKDIIAYVFVSDTSQGKTVRTIRIPVAPKPNIEDVELPPEDEYIVRELIVVVNDLKGTLDTIAYTEIEEDGAVELPLHNIYVEKIDITAMQIPGMHTQLQPSEDVYMSFYLPEEIAFNEFTILPFKCVYSSIKSGNAEPETFTPFSGSSKISVSITTSKDAVHGEYINWRIANREGSGMVMDNIILYIPILVI